MTILTEYVIVENINILVYYIYLMCSCIETIAVCHKTVLYSISLNTSINQHQYLIIQKSTLIKNDLSILKLHLIADLLIQLKDQRERHKIVLF